MVLSMTGYGEARRQQGDCSVAVEARSLNNRYLKVTVRGSEPYPLLEPEIEKIVRRWIRRGTLHLHIRVHRLSSPSVDSSINTALLRQYLIQLRQLCLELEQPELMSSLASGLLMLPGLVDASHTVAVPEEEWQLVESALEQALRSLNATRQEEGRQMAQELSGHRKQLQNLAELIESQLGLVQADYRCRLLQRIRSAVAEAGVDVQEEQLLREIAIFADRSDVSEELARFSAHLQQFAEIIHQESDGAGRRLEFVVQELGREVNTLGSKAGDVRISRMVIEIKATLEKIRELVQNIE